MKQPPEPTELASSEIRRAWRIVTWAGLLGSTYHLLCINGAPRVKFLTELEATASHFGLISGLAAFVLAFQIVGSVLTNRIRHRRGWWIFLAIAHRAVYVGVLFAPILFLQSSLRIAWVILIFFLHDALAQISTPLWLSWMADLVPHRTMTRYWASRQRFITAANICVMLAAGTGFHYFELTGQVILGYVLFAGFGIVVGIVDILLFFQVPEPPNERIEHNRWAEILVEPLRDPEFRPFLFFQGYWKFAVFTAAPFFSLFMIDSLKLSVMTVQLLGISSAVGMAISSRFWGMLCDTYGYRPTLQVLSVAKASAPLAFLLAPQNSSILIPYLAGAMFLDGILNSGLNLTTQGYLLKVTPKRNRSMYIAATNFSAAGLMAALAPYLAGLLIDFLNRWPGWAVGPFVFTGYHGAFAASFVLRLLAFPFAAKVREANSVPVRIMLRQLLARDFFPVTHQMYQLHESSDQERRLRAAKRLGVLRNPLAIGELIQALKDSSLAVREAAAESLGRIGLAEATEPLALALFDPTSGIQSPAARALGRIGGPNSLRSLVRFLRNKDSRYLKETIEVLANIGDDAAILPLIALFHDVKDGAVREHIAWALGRLSATESVKEVLALLEGRERLALPGTG
ncbi:MAG: MFS transporter [Candidatus Hydrogenedentes bacterium]|nr:MFS transporter [Candidatus Hydrogenedentota bacterium]